MVEQVNRFGGDTGVDADYLPDGDNWVCYECSDDIELGEEVEIDCHYYCPECAKEKQNEN